MKNLLFIPQASRSSTLAILLLVMSNTLFGQWQATIVTSVYASERTYNIWSDLSNYRYEYHGPERNDAVIVNHDSNESTFMLLGKKKVHYTKTDGKLSQANNPIRSYFYYLQDGIEKDEGTEEIQGYTCKKTSIYEDGIKMITKWYSGDLKITLKLEGHVPGVLSLEIKDISDWNPDPEMFKVPDDFIEVDQNQKIIVK